MEEDVLDSMMRVLKVNSTEWGVENELHVAGIESELPVASLRRTRCMGSRSGLQTNCIIHDALCTDTRPLPPEI
jgi:hypothetical protein